MRSPFAVFVAAGAFALAASVSPSARAEDESIVIEREVRELGKNAAAKEPADKAKEALDRALRFRSVGDDANARLALGLARDWLDAGRDLAQTLDAEKRVAEARAKTRQTEQDLAKARVELEEGVAKASRLQAQVEAKEKERLGTPLPKAESGKGDKKAAPKGDGKPAPKSDGKTAPKKDKAGK